MNDISTAAPGWKNCPNLFFECKEWKLPNGVTVSISRDKGKRFGYAAPVCDRYVLFVEGDRYYDVPEGVFNAFLRIAGRDIERPDE